MRTTKLISHLERNYTNEGNVFSRSSTSSTFETMYVEVRIAEGRILKPNEINKLPQLFNHRYEKEWVLREKSSEVVIRYLKRLNLKSSTQIVELGCGNGWFSNKIATLGMEVLGVDINKDELKQASKIFPVDKKHNLYFLYEDLMINPLPAKSVDIFILNSSLQYFSAIDDLFTSLRFQLVDDGEIVILDTPIYNKREVAEAEVRSLKYYKKLGFPMMATQYYHHNWEDLTNYEISFLHNPKRLKNKIKELYMKTPAFPIFRVIF